MIRISHILRELSRNLGGNLTSSLASFLSLSLLFLLFDLFWVGAGTAQRFYDDLIAELRIELYVSESVPDSLLAPINSRVAAIEGVEAVDYVSKQDAREELARLVGIDPLVGYDINPLPRSFVLTISPGYLYASSAAAIKSEALRIEGIEEVSYSVDWLEKVEKTRAIILNVGMVLGGLILLTSLLSSANNIRLASKTRAVGLYQMRLLGAGKLFVAWPFMLEGFLLGAISAAAGWLIIYYGRGKLSFTQIEIVYPNLEEISIFCGCTALLGLVAGYTGIRKLARQ